VNEEQRKFQEKRFVEDVGLFFEQYGLPRMGQGVFWAGFLFPTRRTNP